MKKKIVLILVILLILLILITLGGCNKKSEKEEEKIVGGWETDTTAKTLNIPKEAREAFTKAAENYDGVELKPMALLGTQVVSGTNYMYLCTSTTVTENPLTNYVIVIVYKDLKGKSEITSVKDFDYTKYTNVEVNEEDNEAVGGWTVYDKTDSQELSENVQEVFDDSLKKLTGATYKPIALLGTQVVSGTNYAILALGTTTTKTPRSYISVLTINEDLNDESKVVSIANLNLADFNE